MTTGKITLLHVMSDNREETDDFVRRIIHTYLGHIERGLDPQDAEDQTIRANTIGINNFLYEVNRVGDDSE